MKVMKFFIKMPKIKLTTVFIIVSLILGACAITFLFLKNEYSKLQSLSIEATLGTSLTTLPTPESKSQDLKTTQYELLEGWNFVAFPFRPLSFTTAAGLVSDIANNGGFVTTVSSWDGDRWIEYTHSGEKQYGLDFPIVPGKAYFLRSHEQYSWKVYGIPLQKMPELELKRGWNALGLVEFNGQKAESFLDQLSKGKDIAREIDWWQSGSWDVFVKRIYAEDNIQIYGNNFTIDETKGYLIQVTQDSKVSE